MKSDQQAFLWKFPQIFHLSLASYIIRKTMCRFTFEIKNILVSAKNFKAAAGNTERCLLDGVATTTIYDLEFSSDGMKLFTTTRDAGSDLADADKAYSFDLTLPYDVSTCTLASQTTDLDSSTFTSGSLAGNFDHVGSQNRKHRLQGIEINNDGTNVKKEKNN